MQRTTLAWASAILLIAVAFGAFGAHGLKARLQPDALSQWHTGVNYQFYHGLALLFLSGFGEKITSKQVRWARLFFLLGILCFSGSLYLLSTREVLGVQDITPVLGPITPVGGLFFMAGWVVLLITALRTNDRR